MKISDPFRYQEEEVKDKPVSMLIKNFDSHKRELSYEAVAVTKDGSNVPVSISTSDTSGQGR